jgi:hypothetical protein
MSGLKFDNFVPPVISSKTHSIIDYIHAGTNFAAAPSMGAHRPVRMCSLGY